jgi:hypothetical protein
VLTIFLGLAALFGAGDMNRIPTSEQMLGAGLLFYGVCRLKKDDE